MLAYRGCTEQLDISKKLIFKNISPVVFNFSRVQYLFSVLRIQLNSSICQGVYQDMYYSREQNKRHLAYNWITFCCTGLPQWCIHSLLFSWIHVFVLILLSFGYWWLLVLLHKLQNKATKMSLLTCNNPTMLPMTIVTAINWFQIVQQ